MSPILHHESTRVPVTALASCGALLITAEGPFLRFYHAKSSRYLASRRVFQSQAVHGICVYAEDLDNITKLVVWGGYLVRAIRIDTLTADEDEVPSLWLSNVVKAPDWILDLAPRMSSLDDEDVYSQGTCAAVTAHNALLKFTIHRQKEAPPKLEMSELTKSSRSILYSAHLLWDSSDCILVAAGTAFGEIMYWSWNESAQGQATSSIHRVFLGHEGSIFDVRISQRLQRGCCGALKRAIASCSDDRTIRLWDVSDIDVGGAQDGAFDESAEAQRTRHTGFSIAATDMPSDNRNCLAIGWGHTSRVWKVRFLDSSPCNGSIGLLSAGEDATSRTWKLVAATGQAGTLPYTLQQTNCAAHHNGKNMWATTTYRQAAGSVRVACGAADSKLTTHPLLDVDQTMGSQATTLAEYSMQDLIHMAQPSTLSNKTGQLTKTSKKDDSIRSYCFIQDGSFLLVTNSGKVLIESLDLDTASSQSRLKESVLVDQIEDLSSYSTCTGVPNFGVAFIAGARGNIYMYSAHDSSLKVVHTATGKVGSLFVTEITSSGRQQLMLFVSLVGQKHAKLLHVDLNDTCVNAILIPVSDVLTGSIVTSMSVVEAESDKVVLMLGFRRGSIALYTVSYEDTNLDAALFRFIEKAHGDETVTALDFQSLPGNTAVGHLYSVGRDGSLVVHLLDCTKNTVELVHNLALPVGPNIEGLYFHGENLMVHGFSSKRWVLYDVTSEEEVMGIETGGAHRSWAFQPSSDLNSPYGGTLLWTRTSSLHICSQKGPNHEVLRSGGHGREIKAVAASPPHSANHGLIATGAEDTDIRIFQYIDSELVCRATLRKHTTGIQHLQWSDDGNYLFSSAGSEEFYIWRIRALNTLVDIGIVCESVYMPESEFSDLRIMSFDVARHDTGYVIAMVFSDSSIKTYRYTPALAPHWHPLSSGTYFTSCLTQCVFLTRSTLLTAGTDGHSVLWPFSSSTSPQTPLPWHHPTRLHQNASKTLSTHVTRSGAKLVVSGGDDGSLAFLLTPDPAAASAVADATNTNAPIYASPPVLIPRAHASAVTACAIVSFGSRVLVLSSGNDEWVRVWEVVIRDEEDAEEGSNGEKLVVSRLERVKTSVADVSSMAVLGAGEGEGEKVVVCGVGMEVLRVGE